MALLSGISSWELGWVQASLLVDIQYTAYNTGQHHGPFPPNKQTLEVIEVSSKYPDDLHWGYHVTERLQTVALKMGVTDCCEDLGVYVRHTTSSITDNCFQNLRHLINCVGGLSVITGLLDDNNPTRSCLTTDPPNEQLAC